MQCAVRSDRKICVLRSKYFPCCLVRSRFWKISAVQCFPRSSDRAGHCSVQSSQWRLTSFISDMYAWSLLQSLMYEMCGSGSEVADPLLPELKGIFRILVKKSCKPPADIFSRWSQDEKEIFAELQKDIHKAAESLALAVPQALICWFLEEFEACLKDISSLSVHKVWLATSLKSRTIKLA